MSYYDPMGLFNYGGVSGGGSSNSNSNNKKKSKKLSQYDDSMTGDFMKMTGDLLGAALMTATTMYAFNAISSMAQNLQE